MIPGSGKHRHIPLYFTAGWLFAELLLGIALVFLVSSPGRIPPPLDTPTPVTPTATFTPQPLLQLSPVTLTLTNVDVTGLEKNNRIAVGNFQDTVMAKVRQRSLDGQSLVALCAGLVIPYGGEPNSTLDYQSVGNAAVAALRALGKDRSKQGQFFGTATYHDTLWKRAPEGTVVLEVYVYTGATPCQ